MPASGVEWLQKWYLEQCNGVWEHSRGVSIDTMDNPGWLIKINLRGTSLETKALARDVLLSVSDPTPDQMEPGDRWVECSIRDGCFVGAGGALDLSVLIDSFREWARPETETG